MTLYVDRQGSELAYRAGRKLRHLRKQAYQLVWPADQTRPVFLVGSGRSGTDIVAYSLSRCRDVELVNEDNPKAFENWRFRNLDDIERVIHASRAPVIAFKPIVETLKTGIFLDRFSHSKAIFLVRHPYDAINSMARFFGERHVDTVNAWVATDFAEQATAPAELREFIKNKCSETPGTADAAALYWLLYNDSYRFLGLSDNPAVLLVGYEQMVQNPETTTRTLASFVGLQWSEGMMADIYDRSVRKHDKPELDAEIEARCLKTWAYLQGYQNPPMQA
ncbi:MAG: sulfotransferase [Pseudomonadota bacterium]